MEPALVRIGEDKVYETSLGGNVEIPIKITRRGDFKDPVKLVAVGLTQQMRPKDVTLDGDKSEGKFELALNQQNIRPGSYTFYMKGEIEAQVRAQSRSGRRRRSRAEASGRDDQGDQRRDQVGHRSQERSGAQGGPGEAQGGQSSSRRSATSGWTTPRRPTSRRTCRFALISTPIKLRIHASPLKLDAGARPRP